MDLKLEGQELNVGNFRADILCRNVADGSRVLIENQLEKTDHSHLGQILTYATGLDVHAVIWIAKTFREEHSAVLDQLNEIAGEKFRYFGIEVRVWQIGDSTPAPQFEIVSKPKDWRSTISRKAQRAASKDTSETQLQQLKRYWTEWDDYMIQKLGKRSFQNFDMDPYGSEFIIDAYRIHEKKEIGVRLCIVGENAKKYFRLLKEQQEEIEREFAEPIEWDERPLQGYSQIFLQKTDTDPTDETDWLNQHEWLATKLEKFDAVFRPRIKALNATNRKFLEDEDEV